MFISIFPEKGKCYQVKIPELDLYKIVEAKFDRKVLMVVGVQNNQYDRLVFRFNNDFTTYDLRKVENITHTGLNFITLDTGVCVCLNEEDKIEAFSNKIGSQQLKIIEDKSLGSDMTLFAHGSKAMFHHKNIASQISIK